MEAPYLYKAKKLYKVIWYSLGASILVSIALRVLDLQGYYLTDLLVGLPTLMAFAISPLGLVYILKSYLKKERYKKQKLLYLFGMIFFNLIVVAMVFVIISDISKIFA
ncbi:putative membrane protein [Pontibacter sp. HSC-36F09]|nr:putative membrane protein [Pontibacter sp. HSC-36F09]